MARRSARRQQDNMRNSKTNIGEREDVLKYGKNGCNLIPSGIALQDSANLDHIRQTMIAIDTTNSLCAALDDISTD